MAGFEVAARVRGAMAADAVSFRALSAASGCSVGHLQRLVRGEVAAPTPDVLRRLAASLPSLSYHELLRLSGYL